MKIVVDVSTKWRHKGVTANGPTEKELKMQYHIKMIESLTEFLGRGNQEAIESRIQWHKIQLRKYGIFAI